MVRAHFERSEESWSGSDDRVAAAIACRFTCDYGSWGSEASPEEGSRQALLLAIFLYSEGVILTCFLNTALKADFELKPTSSAMAMTV